MTNIYKIIQINLIYLVINFKKVIFYVKNFYLLMNVLILLFENEDNEVLNYLNNNNNNIPPHFR
jgi:predicted tellurium resistance membrane protein TerC